MSKDRMGLPVYLQMVYREYRLRNRRGGGVEQQPEATVAVEQLWRRDQASTNQGHEEPASDQDSNTQPTAPEVGMVVDPDQAMELLSECPVTAVDSAQDEHLLSIADLPRPSPPASAGS